MTYLMELIDFEIKEAQARVENEGAVGTSHLLNLSNQQVCSFVHLVQDVFKSIKFSSISLNAFIS